MKQAERRQAALERFRKRLEDVDYFEKQKRSDELYNMRPENDGWYEANLELQACKVHNLMLDAFMNGATCAGMARLLNKHKDWVRKVVNRTAAGRYFKTRKIK